MDEQERAKKKQKKQNAKEQPIRQKISFSDFLEIIELCNAIKHPVSRARIKIGFFLLYGTGIRISNLLVFTTGMVRELMEKV